MRSVERRERIEQCSTHWFLRVGLPSWTRREARSEKSAFSILEAATSLSAHFCRVISIGTPAKVDASSAMLRWNSRATTAIFLITMLSTDAVLGGIVQRQHARLRKSDDKLLGESTEHVRQSRDLKAEEISSLSTLAEVQNSDLELKRKDVAVGNSRHVQDSAIIGQDLIRAGKEKLKEEETAQEAMGAIAYVAGVAATFLTRPLINNMPPNFNKAIIGIASVISNMKTNATEDTSYDDTATNNETVSLRRGKEFPAYNFDGVISTATAWLNGENMDRVDSIAPSYEERAPYASLKGPEAARLGIVDPLLTVLGVIRRTIATEFLTTALVMTIAHLTRLFFVNLPTIIPILGLSPRIDRGPELVPKDAPQMLGQIVMEGNSNFKVGEDTVKRAELLAREIVAAVTRDQCAERAACLIGAHLSQYRFTPTVMRFLRSPEPTQEKPNHPVWIAFRDSAEGRGTADECDLKYSC